jgi:ribosomal protein L18
MKLVDMNAAETEGQRGQRCRGKMTASNSLRFGLRRMNTTIEMQQVSKRNIHTQAAGREFVLQLKQKNCAPPPTPNQ